MNKKKVVVKLLETMREISDTQKDLDDIIGETEFLFFKVDDLSDILLDILDIPEDNSLEHSRDDEDFFTRDTFYGLVFDYTLRQSDISASEVYYELVMLREKYCGIELEYNDSDITDIMQFRR